MFYKSILNAVAVAVAVVAVMFVGCGSDDDGGGDGGGGGDLVGDWSVVESKIEGGGQVEIQTIPDNMKVFFTFRSNTMQMTLFGRFGNFWFEEPQETLEYRLKDGNSICIVNYDGGGYEGDNCLKYSISGNTLTLTESFSEDGYTYSSIMVAKRDDVAAFRSSNKIISQDPALMNTRWVDPSEDGEIEWERARIAFNMYGGLSYQDSRGIYISDYCDATFCFSDNYYIVWYTEGSLLTLVRLDCAEYETVVGDEGYEWESCVSYSESETKTLDYELTNGTLRLRAPGGDWDVWVPGGGGYYFSQSKAKAEKGNRAVSPFWAFRR